MYVCDFEIELIWPLGNVCKKNMERSTMLFFSMAKLTNFRLGHFQWRSARHYQRVNIKTVEFQR